MCDKELLVAYLYDELGDTDRGRIETHLRDCAECRGDLKALGGVRADLVAWTPPQPDFGWRVVRDRRPSWRAWWTPAAGLAAAAVLVLAAASALAHVEFRYGQDGFTVRTGWSASAAPAQTARGFGETSPSSQVVTPTPASVAGGLEAAAVAQLERRIRALESGPRESPVRQASLLGPRMSDAEILTRFRELLAQSEARQRGELALRIAQVNHDVDAQRVADLNRIQQGIGRIDASVTAEAVVHRDLANYILTSSKQQK